MFVSFGLSMNIYDNEELLFSGMFNEIGNTLIAEFANHCVIEVDSYGNIVWEKTGLNVPQDAERLPNGNTLITDYGDQVVIEVDKNGNEVWNKSRLNLPMDAERLPNGNTLIVEYGAGSVIEVDINGNIVWQITKLHQPMDAERLPNGNTLIAETELYPDGRVIEVDSAGGIIWIVWEKTGLDGPVDAERLDNGNTLITEHTGKRVIEVDKNGVIIWQKSGLLMPSDAERLFNGNTLIAETGANRVIEVDSTGENKWIKSGLHYPVDAERINQPPDAPIIDGPNTVKIGVEYNFTFSTEDPENDNMSYYIDWGDGTHSDWLGPYNSGETVIAKNTWNKKKKTYEIKAKAKDIYEAESDWGIFTITRSTNYQVSQSKVKNLKNILFLKLIKNKIFI